MFFLVTDVFLLLVNVVLYLLDIVILFSQIGLEVLLLLLKVRVLHHRIFLHQLVLKFFEQAVVALLVTEHVLVVIGKRDTLFHHYAYIENQDTYNRK